VAIEDHSKRKCGPVRNYAIMGSNSRSYNLWTDTTVPCGLQFRLCGPAMELLTPKRSAAFALELLVFLNAAFQAACV